MFADRSPRASDRSIRSSADDGPGRRLFLRRGIRRGAATLAAGALVTGAAFALATPAGAYVLPGGMPLAPAGPLLLAPYKQGNYVNENFPGSVQTQVTGLNDKGV